LTGLAGAGPPRRSRASGALRRLRHELHTRVLDGLPWRGTGRSLRRSRSRAWVLCSAHERRLEVGRRPRAVARGARRGRRRVLGPRDAQRALRGLHRARADRLEPEAPE
jgi:hypothetical protein